jgi:hypothetical protein
MNLTVTNISGTTVYIREFYRELEAGASITVERSSTDLPGMAGLQKLIAEGKVAYAVTYSADELASGLQSPPQAITSDDMHPVAGTDLTAPVVTFRKTFAAGGGGAADDVTIYAANALPFKFRVLDVVAHIVANVALSTLEIRSRAGGLGTLASTVSSATAGRVNGAAPSNATVALTPGALEGLFIRRSDNAVSGEVIVIARIES